MNRLTALLLGAGFCLAVSAANAQETKTAEVPVAKDWGRWADGSMKDSENEYEKYWGLLGNIVKDREYEKYWGAGSMKQATVFTPCPPFTLVPNWFTGGWADFPVCWKVQEVWVPRQKGD